jgi:hypothetical protein
MKHYRAVVSSLISIMNPCLCSYNNFGDFMRIN